MRSNSRLANLGSLERVAVVLVGVAVFWITAATLGKSGPNSTAELVVLRFAAVSAVVSVAFGLFLVYRVHTLVDVLTQRLESDRHDAGSSLSFSLRAPEIVLARQMQLCGLLVALIAGLLYLVW